MVIMTRDNWHPFVLRPGYALILKITKTSLHISYREIESCNPYSKLCSLCPQAGILANCLEIFGVHWALPLVITGGILQYVYTSSLKQLRYLPEGTNLYIRKIITKKYF